MKGARQPLRPFLALWPRKSPNIVVYDVYHYIKNAELTSHRRGAAAFLISEGCRIRNEIRRFYGQSDGRDISRVAEM
jgi:hypothetical protein